MRDFIDMKFVKTIVFLAASALVGMQSSSLMRAQDVNAQILLHPPADTWPGYHGDYSGRRHSALTEITPQNVKARIAKQLKDAVLPRK